MSGVHGEVEERVALRRRRPCRCSGSGRLIWRRTRDHLEEGFLLPERAQPAPEVHELPVESRQLSGALRCGSQSGHVGRSADSCWAQSRSGALVSMDTEVPPSRIQLAPHARRRAVLKTSEWVPVIRLTSDEVTKSGRTGIMNAYTQNMLSRKRTLWTA